MNVAEQLNSEQLNILMDIGQGDVIKGVKVLISRFKKTDKDTAYYNSANRFINLYLERAGHEDRITVTDLYNEYCEFTKYQLGKKAFNKLLEHQGYPIRSASSNRLTVFCIKSNWI